MNEIKIKNIKYLKNICSQIDSRARTYRDSKREDCKYWRKVDSLLYELCKKFPDHDYLNHVFVKVSAIDRFYNAWLYRKRVRYIDVAKKLQNSNIDVQLSRMRNRLTSKNIMDVVDAVNIVADCRSKGHFVVFASKYLHFHKPNIFPILDKFAEDKMREISKKGGRHLGRCACKNRYECFCRQLIELRVTLRITTGRKFSLSDFDKFLYGSRYF